ncbi:MAG: hypothetical protein U9Q92_06935 [archaeon]|nr:hypothetical protein [archaeon]
MKKNKIINLKKRKNNPSKSATFNHLLIALFMMLSFAPLAYADTSLGSTFTAKNLRLSPGQQEIIEVTFFNTGSTDIDLYIEQITPIEKTSTISDIKAYIMQKKNSILVIDSSLTLKSVPATKTPKKDPDAPWVVLGEKGDLYVPAKKVYFLIEVPNKKTYAKNKYTLVFRVCTQNINTIHDSTTASIGQVREFPQTVTIQNIVPNPKYADENTGQPKKTYTPLRKTTHTLADTTNDLPQSDTNDNYINNQIPQDDTSPDNSAPNAKNPNNTSAGNNTPAQNTDIKDHITGLVTGNNPSGEGPYNYMTIIIILLGTFVLYRIVKSG